jgi:hypothetical protein
MSGAIPPSPHAFMAFMGMIFIFLFGYESVKVIPVAARSKAWVCGRSLAEMRVRIPPGAWMPVVSVVCCHVEVSVSG